MGNDQNPSPIHGQGEYGATTVEITRNRDAYRLAFGRHNGSDRIFLGAVLLTKDAFMELKSEIESTET